MLLASLPLLVAPLVSAAPVAPQEVPYERFQLENGLTVILHVDRAQPQVVVNTWYWVGGKDETPGRSGFAHLFEHLMFLGTERAPDSTFDDLMEAGGGWNNASTSQDRTNYYDIGPAELLPTLLWLEADRMQALGPNITQAKLDGEREVVRNERRQSYEDVPYGRAELVAQGLLYPPGHPYHIPVIGTHADLEAATLAEVQTFFSRYYVPANASLVVAGDFDPEIVRPMIERFFGSIPRGDDAIHAQAEPVVLTEERIHTMTDAVPFARTEMMWPSPAFLQPGDAEMDLLATILAGGVSSRLYRALIVDSPLAEEVSAAQRSGLLGSEFEITVLARPGVELSAIEAAVDKELGILLSDGPSKDELVRQKALIEAQTLRRLQSVERKADALNRYLFYFDEPDSFLRDLDRYRDATVESCIDWSRKVFGQGGRVILRVLPEASAPDADPLATVPGPLGEREFVPESPARFELSNGVAVESWVRGDLPLVELLLVLPFGSGQDPEGKGGLVSLAGSMLLEGSGERDSAEFTRALERLGAALDVSVNQRETALHLSVLGRHFDAALDLLADALLRPHLELADWERVQRARLSALAVEAQNPSAIARVVGTEAFFGPGHPHAHPSQGTLQSVEPLLLNDVAQVLSDLYRPEGARLWVAGDVDSETLKASLERALGAWSGLANASERVPSTVPAPESRDAARLILVDRPGATQTAVRFMIPAPAYGTAGRSARELATIVLGGTFTSRLNTNLRVDKGITYGARARLVHLPPTAYLLASAQIQTEHTGLGVGEFLKEFARLRQGDIDGAEASKARSSKRLSTIAGFATLGQLLSSVRALDGFGREIESVGDELSALESLQAEDLNRAAPSLVDLDRAVIVLVGDKQRILPQLQGIWSGSVEVVGD